MNDEIIKTLIQKVEALEREQKRLASLEPLFSILSSNFPAQITANQNDYDPGKADVLFLFSDASRNITGLTGGVTGRFLWINTYGANNIVLVHNSVLSQAANRLSCHTAANITLTPRKSAILTYTGVVWNVIFHQA